MRRTAFLTMLALLLAMPLAAYTVYFKNGTTLQCKGKPRIVNGRAVVTLLNNTQAGFDPKDIDEKKTEEMNKRDLGAAVMLDTGANRPQAGPPATPAPRPRLSDIAASREIGPREQPAIRRDASASTRAGKTRLGFVDLTTLPRNPYADAAAGSELRQFFLGQKAEAVEIYQGTQAGRPLAEITTSSESSVFRGLVGGANALLHIRSRYPAISGIELLMITPSRERAGQFFLTPEMAEDLVAKRVGLVSFFLNNVQF
ncbi:MAG TPA: hypothetical protein VE078_08390 [Thermoanaerobaculia bacterium]|nr:hypothetical protein [Thermoanaerobaculia bacterium]